MKTIALFALLLLLATFYSCDRRKSSSSSAQVIYADTIVYEALIHNIDPSAPWQTDWLKGLNREAYIDKLFELVYNKEIQVVDYDTQERLSIKDIKEWEANNPRSTIGKLQFTETWSFDNGQFNKHIIAIMPAYEVFTEDGELRAYKAKVKMIMKRE